MSTKQEGIVRSEHFSRYVPYQVTTSSEALGWRGFRAEVVRGHAANEILLPPLDHHLLNLIVTAPTRHAHRWDGSAGEETGHEGAASLVPQGRESYWRWTYLSTATPCDFHIHLDPAFVRRVAARDLCELPPQVELHGELCFYNEPMRMLAMALLEEMENDAPHGTLYAESLATALVTVLLTMQEPWRRGEIAKRSARVGLRELRTVCEYIEAHLDGELHLEVLGALAGFGPERLRHVFRATLGESPHRYVTRRRVERARELLRSTRLPMTEIALRLGFADHSHFTQTFRRQTGLTPSRFRAEALR